MKKILVVDNHPLILQFMVNLLKKRGYEVLTVLDGLSALDILKDYIPDVIFIDLVMPNIDGKRLCQIIRKNPDLRDTYIIILSSIVAEEGINLEEFGADACIAKGPLKKMAENILAILDKIEKKELERSPEVLGIEGIIPREITKELLWVKKHFEIILSSMSEGILEITPTGRIVYANPFALSLICKTEEELLGLDFISLFAQEDRQRIKSLLEAASIAPQKISEEAPVILNNKQIILTFLPVKDEEHNSIIVILVDITEKKQMEARLLQAQKMEAIGTLAGGIAHDFNNLLMGIQGHISLMLMKMDVSHCYFKHLKAIENMVKRGAELTKQLLGFARKGKYEVKSINLNEIIENCLEMFGQVRKEINIHKNFQKDIWLVEADRSQMEQVFLNLFVNAADAMPKGGELYVETKNIVFNDVDIKTLPFKTRPGDYVKISITDTGIGMDEATQQRIFEPFFTTKERGRGTGLGLASVYGIIKNHEGFITVYSKKGKGTTFNIYLPASKKGIQKEKTSSKEILKGNETILIIDDEEEILKVTAEMLKSLGYKVIMANDGKEAIEIYQKNKKDIQLVILDIIMPGMNGKEVYETLRTIDPKIKVIISSGYSFNNQINEILKQECVAFIQKPFSLKELSQIIREVLDKK
ncbi:MAG TPA: hybrid sensor histidine kinase/response regulator [Candidatus Desulfofervidus auxilii]|uniref:histidine kinase n=1 Tax=Desulfofervidus auxilii TaxID=1621989 RepID=A0A7C0U342_DESA2|nr:hybrid sensor histidine kinase/response regulator [Candidatus Desulfofervidus auxilii]